MAASSSSESQGIKIALVAFVVLTVILGVSVYFTASNSSLSASKLDAANKEKTEEQGKARVFLEQANFFRTKAGYATQEDFDAAKAAMTKDLQRITAVIQAIGARTATAVNEAKKAGDSNPKLDQLVQAVQSDIQAIVSEPSENQIYLKTFDRLALVLSNQSDLMTQLALNYQGLRGTLESANKVNQSEVATVGAARDKANADKEAEIARNASEIQDLRKKVDDYQTELAKRATDYTNLTNETSARIAQLIKERDEIRLVNRDIKDALSRSEDVLDKPAGKITFVDYNSGQARVNVNRSQGAKPLMRLTVFDRNSPGIPNQKPKGIVELISVGDPKAGQTDSLAKIISTTEPTNPIRPSDLIYSPVWSPEKPKRFALIGKLDVDRDGKDDRGELIRMIEAAGGIVEFDLPPAFGDRAPGRAAVARGFERLGLPVPKSKGHESGEISGLTTAYVTDDRRPLTRSDGKEQVPTKEDAVYLQEQSKAQRQARDNGVTPMTLERLLTYLGYQYNAPAGHARIEAKNKEGLKTITNPKGNKLVIPAPTPAADPAAPATDPAEPKAAAPKEEMPK